MSGLGDLWVGSAGSALATAGLALALAWLGGLVVSVAGGREPANARWGVGSGSRAAALVERFAPYAVAGLVALHLLLLAFDLTGVPWRRRTVVAGLLTMAAAVGLAARLARGAAHPAAERLRPADPPGWGDGLALSCLAVFATAAWSLRATIPDFVYHWGVKAKRYHMAGGIDWAWLGDPLRPTAHPDYPNLVPGLYAATAHLRGYFDERALLCWSVVFFALCLLAARRALAGAGGPAVRSASLAVVATALAVFAIGYRMAGSADWLIALALLAALPALLEPEGETPHAADRPSRSPRRSPRAPRSRASPSPASSSPSGSSAARSPWGGAWAGSRGSCCPLRWSPCPGLSAT